MKEMARCIISIMHINSKEILNGKKVISMGIKFIKLLLICFLLVGCASYPGEPPIEPENITRESLKDYGFVVFSVTQSWAGESRPDNRRLKISWRKFSDNKGNGWIDLNESRGIQFSQFKSLPFMKSQLMVIKLEEGNYRLSNVSVVYNGRGYSGSITGIPTRFHVSKGKVNYIGNIGFKFVMKHKRGGYNFKIADTRKADIPVFLSSYKVFSKEDIKFSVLGNFDWDKYAPVK